MPTIYFAAIQIVTQLVYVCSFIAISKRWTTPPYAVVNLLGINTKLVFWETIMMHLCVVFQIDRDKSQLSDSGILTQSVFMNDPVLVL